MSRNPLKWRVDVAAFNSERVAMLYAENCAKVRGLPYRVVGPRNKVLWSSDNG